LASAPEMAAFSGSYFEKGYDAIPSPAAQDEEAARKLWEVSARIVGLPDENGAPIVISMGLSAAH
jgi:hypothetical protein